MKIVVVKKPSLRSRQIINDGLDDYNRTQAPDRDSKPLHIFLQSGPKIILGGALGASYWKWLHIRSLWIHESVRGQDFGSKLLKKAEQEALRRGCIGITLDTFSFQALPFYKKNGYKVVGSIADFPPGQKRFYLTKRLKAKS
jgi:GNAT superfamily N-acetyltransferase